MRDFNFERKFGEDDAIFFGSKKGLLDTVVCSHPKLESLFLAQKATDWMYGEFPLEKDREDMHNCPDGIRDLMLYNLLFQWHLDSVAADGLFPLFAPFLTNSEASKLFSLNGQMEYVHAATYSEIMRQCIPDRVELEKYTKRIDEVRKRLDPVFKNLADLKDVGCEYSLGQITAEAAYPYVLKGLITWWCMEKIQFMASFPIPFAIKDSTGWFPNICNYIQKIMLDELNIHAETMKYIIQWELQTERGKRVWQKIRLECLEIVDSFVEAEKEWARFLPTEGRSLVGLTPLTLCDNVDYEAVEVYNTLFGDSVRYMKGERLPVMAKWLNPDHVQVANMELDNNNYLLNVMVEDYTGDIDEY